MVPEQNSMILSGIEMRLRSSIERAVRENRYEDLADLAAIAADIARVRAAIGIGATSAGVEEMPAKSSVAGRGAPSLYPRFERRGDRLVKIGWSKQDKSAYEHKAPWSAVAAVVEAAAAKLRPGRKFELDSLGSIADTQGKAIPVYQVYLTLRWLLQLGMMSKRGKSDYVLMRAVTKEEVERAWQGLATAA